MTLCRCLVVKLLTPIALASPSRWHSSIPRHTPSKSNGMASSFLAGNDGGPALMQTGQWIRVSRRAGTTRSGWHLVHQSLDVTNSSSRDATSLRRSASATASPSGFSVAYASAVSKWR
nr:unnamed protein product [Digitaria exilis]